MCRDSDSKEEVACAIPLRVKLTTTQSPANMSDWSLLDCTFGIPLFDADLNKIICISVVERLLYKERYYTYQFVYEILEYFNIHPNIG